MQRSACATNGVAQTVGVNVGVFSTVRSGVNFRGTEGVAPGSARLVRGLGAEMHTRPQIVSERRTPCMTGGGF